MNRIRNSCTGSTIQTKERDMRIAVLSVAALALSAGTAAAVVVGVDQSTAPWLGFMNVFELPANGGGFVFPSPWAVGDLAASFNDGAQTLTLSPNTIGDPSPFWYTPAGGPGAAGNKIMEANLYQQVTDTLSGQTVTFQGNVLSNTLTSAHTGIIFVRDFAPDFSSFTESTIPLVNGPFSVSLATQAGVGRSVQWGFQIKGVNVWVTDVAPFGTAVIGTIPTPGATGLLVAGAAVTARRRRR
jgi:hypothetical protein